MVLGKVYLVGAGPGDPGLLTVRGRECLEQADVVLADRLVGEGVLRYVREGAEVIDVGKVAGHPHPQQQTINRLMVEHALRGRVVVRLKGGDPFVFGRGGEEALYLVQRGIPFEVVPGVSSALAGPALAGIPVTHRGVASSVLITTGHEDPAKGDSSLRWQHLARAADTLVFLMPMGHLDRIAHSLLCHGRSPSEPAALVRWASTPQQQVLLAPLAQLPRRALEANFAPPAILIVGHVVTLAGLLNNSGQDIDCPAGGVGAR